MLAILQHFLEHITRFLLLTYFVQAIDHPKGTHRERRGRDFKIIFAVVAIHQVVLAKFFPSPFHRTDIAKILRIDNTPQVLNVIQVLKIRVDAIVNQIRQNTINIVLLLLISDITEPIRTGLDSSYPARCNTSFSCTQIQKQKPLTPQK